MEEVKFGWLEYRSLVQLLHWIHAVEEICRAGCIGIQTLINLCLKTLHWEGGGQGRRKAMRP